MRLLNDKNIVSLSLSPKLVMYMKILFWERTTLKKHACVQEHFKLKTGIQSTLVMSISSDLRVTFSFWLNCNTLIRTLVIIFFFLGWIWGGLEQNGTTRKYTKSCTGIIILVHMSTQELESIYRFLKCKCEDLFVIVVLEPNSGSVIILFDILKKV